jgi:hypothetical protein
MSSPIEMLGAVALKQTAIVDMRCPKCNNPVTKNAQEVEVLRRIDLPHVATRCVHCEIGIRLVKDEPLGGAECWAFDFLRKRYNHGQPRVSSLRSLSSSERDQRKPPVKEGKKRTRIERPKSRYRPRKQVEVQQDDLYAWRSRLLVQWPRVIEEQLI